MCVRIQFSKKQLEKLPNLQKEARLYGNMILFRRATALLMLRLNATQHDIAQAIGVCRESISRWIALFLARGAAGLRPKKSPGRKSRLSKQQHKCLKQQVQKGPQAWGYPGGVWTSAMLQEHIQKQFGVFYTIGYIPELMRNIGLSYIKPKYTFSLSREELKEQIKWIRKGLPDLYEKVKACDGVLLFQDESTCQLQPNVMVTWAIKGQPPTMEKNASRGSFRIFGTIELFTGKLLYSIKELNKENPINNKVFTQFVRQVAQHYKGRDIFIVMDSASYHSGPTLRRFLENHPNVHLEKQPKKSPNVNPIEKVWKELKKDYTHNVYFKGKAALKKALRKGLMHLQSTPERIRGLMKKWEKVVLHPEDAIVGKYDASLVPNKHQHDLETIQWEVSNELVMSMLNKN